MTFLSKLTLKKRITLLTASGLFLGVAIFSYLGIRAVDQATETMLQDRLTTAGLVADYVDESLERALTELKTTAQMIEGNGTKGEFEHQMEALDDTYSRLSIYTYGIYLLNEEGQLVWSKPEVAAEGSDISLHPIIDQAVKSNEAGISGLISIPTTDTPAVLLYSPTKEGQRGSKGVLVVAIEPTKSSIGGFIQPLRLGNTGYVEIVDQNGIVVARTEPGPKLIPFEKSDHSGRFAELIARREPSRGVCHTCHEPEQKVIKRDVMAFVPLSSADWGIVIRQSEEEALAPVRELRQSLLVFGVVLVAFAFLFVAVTTRDVVNRIRMLAATSRRIAEGDLTSPVSRSGNDEISMLADDFDDMRVKLMESQEKLKQAYQEVQRKEKVRGELLRDLLLIQEEERRRISRELHDETSQTVASINVNLEAAINNLPANVDKAKSILRKTQNQSISILEEIHSLIFELRPALLDDLGLVTAMQWLIETNLEKMDITVDFKIRGRERKLKSQLEITLFRIVQEAVHNIARHSNAKMVNVSLHFMKGAIKVCIKDNGIGFDVGEAMSMKDGQRGLGVLGMKERVELMEGTFDIRSWPDTGTEISIEIPLNKEVSSG